MGVLSGIAAALFSCADRENKTPDYDPSQPVVRSFFYPDSGKIASKVLLNGENFGSDPTNIRVYFNRKKAAVIRSSGSQMYVVVPRMPGDTCDVSVAVGNDSAAYTQKFRYFQSVSVQTVTGNGDRNPLAGTLAEATLSAQYLCVDLEGNVFVTVGGGNDRTADYGEGYGMETAYGIFKINEAANKAEILIMVSTPRDYAANGLCTDENTGIILIANEGKIEEFTTLDPRENFAVRRRNLRITETNGFAYPSAGKHSMAWCKADNMIYGKWYSGQVFRMNPKTYEAELIGMTVEGTWPGFANDPANPEWMYMSARSGSASPGIWKFNIHDFAGTIQRIHAPGAGHRDGPVAFAQFNEPWQIFFDQDGSLYVADAGNHCIRRIAPDGKMVETVLGIPGKRGWKDGTKEDALFFAPRGIGVTRDGTVYVADWGNRRLRKLIVE
jgi:hypothetical protein